MIKIISLPNSTRRSPKVPAIRIASGSCDKAEIGFPHAQNALPILPLRCNAKNVHKLVRYPKVTPWYVTKLKTPRCMLPMLLFLFFYNKLMTIWSSFEEYGVGKVGPRITHTVFINWIMIGGCSCRCKQW